MEKYQEVFRLVKLARELTGDELLKAALDGRDRTTPNVLKLYAFVLREVGQPESPYPNRPELGSTTARKFYDACGSYLESVGLDPKKSLETQIHPLPGRPGFVSVLQEFEA